MKFNFKIQQYQTDAVEAVVRVFAGQGLHEKVGYRRDVGKISNEPSQMTLAKTSIMLMILVIKTNW